MFRSRCLRFAKRCWVVSILVFWPMEMASAQSGQELLPQRTGNFSFGSGVALSGDVAVISGGAEVRHPTFNSDVSSVDIYRYNGSAWEFETNLISNDDIFWNKIGRAVQLDGSRISIGTPATATGAVLEYTYDGADWNEIGRIESVSTNPRNNFGFFLSMKDDVLVVGDNEDFTGLDTRQYAYIYRHDGSSWQFEDSLSTGLINDDLGYGTTVAASANVVVVGAPFYSAGSATTREGAAYVYEFNGSSWVETQKLTAEQFSVEDARFGQSVTTDGNTIVVGAIRESVDDAAWAGAAYVFTKENGTWILKQRLQPSVNEAYGVFGIVSAISGDHLIIGAPSDTRFENTGGSAYLFKRVGSQWTERSRIVLQDRVANDQFGTSVAIDGDWVIVGAPGRDQGQWNPGGAYVYPVTTLVSNEEAVPVSFETSSLSMYPNPFGQNVRIAFETGTPEQIRLDVFDVLGRRIDTVVNAALSPGSHEYTWHPEGRTPGVYFFRLQTPHSVSTSKGVLIE